MSSDFPFSISCFNCLLDSFNQRLLYCQSISSDPCWYVKHIAWTPQFLKLNRWKLEKITNVTWVLKDTMQLSFYLKSVCCGSTQFRRSVPVSHIHTWYAPLTSVAKAFCHFHLHWKFTLLPNYLHCMAHLRIDLDGCVLQSTSNMRNVSR